MGVAIQAALVFLGELMKLVNNNALTQEKADAAVAAAVAALHPVGDPS
jgi:hypothetical protein